MLTLVLSFVTKVPIPKNKIDNVDLLKEGLSCAVSVWNEQVIDVQLPQQVTYEVVETPLAPITRRTAADSGLPNAAVTSVFSGKEGDVFTFPSRTGDAVMVMQITDITPPSEADMSELAPLANSSLLTSLQTDLDQAMEAEIAATMKLRTNQGTLRAYKATITSDQ